MINPILQMWKLRPSDAYKGQNYDLNAGSWLEGASY